MSTEQPQLVYPWPVGSKEHIRELVREHMSGPGPVRMTVPVEWWSDDWHAGMRARVYVGTVCSHFRSDEGEFCLQPYRHGQAESQKPDCIPITGRESFEALPGKAADW